jgi:nucleoside-diphosphate-sugar epimerase
VRIAVTGASGVVGRGVVQRLLSQGHDVIGLARHRPASWPSAASFVQSDIRDTTGVDKLVSGAHVVVHCAWAVNPAADHPSNHEINVGGTANVLDAMARTGTRRIVLASSAHVYGIDRGVPLSEDARQKPVSSYGLDKARVEEMVAACGVQWVAIRSAAIVGRGVDNWVRRVLASLVFPAGSADRAVQVVHSDDAHRVFARAAIDPGIDDGPVNLAAPGEATLGEIADALGRPTVRSGLLAKLARQLGSSAELDLLLSAPSMDTTLLQGKWNFIPAWTAQECVHDTALAVRGRISIGTWSTSLPWRLTRVQDIPAVDTPAADGVAPVLAGPEDGNGEFDTPIDPRFPTFLATNLSEALPGPFSPSSASVTVKGLRASGAVIAQRLRPG